MNRRQSCSSINRSPLNPGALRSLVQPHILLSGEAASRHFTGCPCLHLPSKRLNNSHWDYCYSHQDERQRALRSGLESINREIESAARKNVAIWFPMGAGHGNERVLRLVAKEAVLLNSRERAPFMLFVEVLTSGDGSNNAEPSPIQQPDKMPRDGPSSSSISSNVPEASKVSLDVSAAAGKTAAGAEKAADPASQAKGEAAFGPSSAAAALAQLQVAHEPPAVDTPPLVASAAAVVSVGGSSPDGSSGPATPSSRPRSTSGAAAALMLSERNSGQAQAAFPAGTTLVIPQRCRSVVDIVALASRASSVSSPVPPADEPTAPPAAPSNLAVTTRAVSHQTPPPAAAAAPAPLPSSASPNTQTPSSSGFSEPLPSESTKASPLISASSATPPVVPTPPPSEAQGVAPSPSLAASALRWLTGQYSASVTRDTQHAAASSASGPPSGPVSTTTATAKPADSEGSSSATKLLKKPSLPSMPASAKLAASPGVGPASSAIPPIMEFNDAMMQELVASGALSPPPRDSMPPSELASRMALALAALRGEQPLVRVRLTVLSPTAQALAAADAAVAMAAEAAPAAAASRHGDRAAPPDANNKSRSGGGAEEPPPPPGLAKTVLSKFGLCGKPPEVSDELDDQGSAAAAAAARRASSVRAARLVSVRLEVAGGVSLALTSPIRKSRRTPSCEALSQVTYRCL